MTPSSARLATGLRFALGGALVFALVQAWPGPPGPSDPGASVDDRLVEEALALGLHRDDAVVRGRLVRNLRFVARDTEEADARELFERALALRLHESDLVVRRRLAQRLRLAALSAAREEPLDDATLQAFLTAHPARFERPARVRLHQVFLSRQRRGEGVTADAHALLARLRGTRADAIEAARVGDPSLLPARIPLRSQADLAARFGPEFAEGVLSAPLGEWTGPLASPFGRHLVFVEERVPARSPALAEVREAVREAVVSERAAERLRAALAAS